MHNIIATCKNQEKTNLLGLSPTKMIDFFASIGEKQFRASQVLQWIHQRGIDCFSEMTNLSKSLRDKLTTIAMVQPPKVSYFKESTDGTCKWIIQVTSGSLVEAVYIPENDRGTLCVSSQAGCALDCSFCSTGKQGFNSNLSSSEIIGSLWIANKHLAQLKQPKKVTNVVFMGMGEPLMNFDNVVDSMQLMMHDLAYGLSKRKVTLSTSGVVPALLKLADYTNASLAISLHAGTDELRNQLVPINRKYPLKQLIAAVKHYMDSLSDSKRVVTIEYTLLAGINDLPEHAKSVAKLLKNIPCKINLIPFNQFPGSDYQRPSNNAIHRFQRSLVEQGFYVTIRKTRGDEINAACGQLVGSIEDKTKRNQRHLQKLASKTTKNAETITF
jgi:23S rRNA (adenine2503-C2)-methyltransferase